MKTFLLRSILGGLTVCAAVTLNLSAAPPPGYHLAWADEFDDTTLDTNKWSTQSKTRLTEDLGLDRGFHTIGVEWTESEYRFYVDDKLTWTAPAPVSKRNQYIILSSEVEDDAWAGKIRAGGYGSLETSRTKMVVDYVRFYERSSASETKK